MDKQFGNLLSEVDTPVFGQVEGFRPLIIIDTSGAVAESWVYIRVALKRMLYSFIVAKSKFNLVKFTSRGTAAWGKNMMPPTAQKLREAEEWLDAVKPSRGSVDFLGGIQWALDVPEADAIYIITSGFPRRNIVDSISATFRKKNVRNLPIHMIGIDCDLPGELDLRRLAEENHGSFRQKRFDGSSDMADGVQHMENICQDNKNEDARLTIGGQLDILDIMVKEHKVQVKDWLDEQRCANRLLLTTATQQPVPNLGQINTVNKQRVTNRISERAPYIDDLHHNTCDSILAVKRVAQRSNSMPRPRSALDAERISIGNPWDQPSGEVRAPKLASKVSAGRGAISTRATKRPNSARKCFR